MKRKIGLASVSILTLALTTTASAAGLKPMYRFYNPSRVTHHYTLDENEKNSIQSTMPDWQYEGIGYYGFSGEGSIESADIKDETVEGGDIKNGEITNADINASAGISSSKIDFSSSDINIGNLNKYKINGTQALSFSSAGATSYNLVLGNGGNNIEMDSGGVGQNNTFIGFLSGIANTRGSDNVAVGNDSLGSNATSGGNVAIGRKALSSLNSGSGNNTAIGWYAASDLTTGTGNVVIGNNALDGNTVGAANVVIGDGAGYGDSNGSTLIGYNAGHASGTNNIAIGAQAGYDDAGSNNIFIGNSSGRMDSNRLYIGTTPVGGKSLIEGDFETDDVEVSGNLLILESSSGEDDGLFFPRKVDDISDLPACDASIEGAIVYNGGVGKYFMCYCDGADWSKIHDPAASCF